MPPIESLDLCEAPLSAQSADVLNLLPLGICIFDRDRNITFWNRTLESWTGISALIMEGERLNDRYPILDTLRFSSRLDQVFETLCPVILSPAIHKYLIPVKIDGDDQRMMVQRITLRPFNPEGTLAMAVIEDVSVTHNQLEQLRSEKHALIAATNEAQNYANLLAKSNEELEQFAYVASHDLQEPLRKISSYCQLLAEEQGDKLDEEGRSFLNIAINGADRLRRMVHDLLLFSRVTTHGKQLTPTDAQECLQVAVENLEITIRDNDAVVTSDALPIIMADDTQLIQLFQNLVGNAIKYRCDDQPVVHVSVNRSGSICEFSVADNGIGIDPRFQERVFKVFQRLHNQRDYEGTGIGLAVCKRIVERFGGNIHIESEAGNGCTFHFTANQQEQNS